VTSVLLLGDSIRMHYQPVVRQELGPDFEVRGPAENCATSRNLLANLERWALAAPASIIHVNAGLHDLRYDPVRTRRSSRSANTRRTSARSSPACASARTQD